MSCNDLLADVLTRIRNGQAAKHAFIVTPSSKLIKDVISVLKKSGYIRSFEEFEERKGVKRLKIDLKYLDHGSPVITEIKRISKSGRRKYSSVKMLGGVYNGLGVSIISTSSGVVSDAEARQLNVSGEILCSVY
jgi:small subunit ribosomal protein S8